MALLIAVALIVTGASAIFNTYASDPEEDIASDSEYRCPFTQEELTEEQKNALEKAKELFDGGDIEGARAVLDEAGINPSAGPFNHGQFIKDLTEEQKAKLQEAHELMQAGNVEGAKAIIDELGIKPLKEFGHHAQFLNNLSEAQKEMLKEAHELMKAGDEEGAQAILDELGIDLPAKQPGKGFRKGYWGGGGVPNKRPRPWSPNKL